MINFILILYMILIILLFISILMISIGWTKSNFKCPKPIIEYRYIPRTFEEEQNEPVKVSKIFDTMFSSETPWIVNR